MYGKFLVEGEKMVLELLSSAMQVNTVFTTTPLKVNPISGNTEFINVTNDELSKIATQTNPDKCLAIVSIPDKVGTDTLKNLEHNLYVVCDNIADPGNAGTIIRTAEWFGVTNVFFSENSVDLYNPKTVAASKGSLFRVKSMQTDIEQLLLENKHLNAYGAFMRGDNIYKTSLGNCGFIVIGNEANGISASIEKLITHRITIPAFGKAESLNAGVATGIILSEFKRAANS